MPLPLLLAEALEGLGRARVDPEQRQDVAEQVELRAELRQLRAHKHRPSVRRKDTIVDLTFLCTAELNQIHDQDKKERSWL